MWVGLQNNTTPVAVKTRKEGVVSKEDFLAEAQLMKELQHENIIQLYGVCTHGDPIYIVTELMKNGNLLDYLRKGMGCQLKFPELVAIGAQVAKGMAYLEKQHYIRCDLAARNVLVGENNIVKIANFGLAQVFGQNKSYTPPDGVEFSIELTAPEAFQHQHFSTKSDVWSFGILLWELVTYGHTPYYGMTDEDVKDEVSQGYRMPKPSGCPEHLYQIMLDCWKSEPEERPTFDSFTFNLMNYSK